MFRAFGVFIDAVVVWDLGDLGAGLMTVFNMIAILPMGGHAIASLKEYETLRKQKIL